jgi:hypothetical protein
MLVVSCSEDAIQSHRVIENGFEPFLTFKNASEMNDYLGAFVRTGSGTLKPDQMPSNFRSMESHYLEIMEELEKAETAESFEQIVTRSKNIVKLDAEGIVVPRIDSRLYRIICNVQGIYKSDGKLHRMLDGGQIVLTASATITDLLSFDQSKSYDRNEFQIAQYQSPNSVAAREMSTCGSAYNMEPTVIYDVSGCTNDRQTWLRIYAHYMVSGDYYTPWFQSYTFSKKKNLFCNWSNYSTAYKTQGANIVIHWNVTNTSGDKWYNTTNLPNYDGEQLPDELTHYIVPDEQIGPAVAWLIPAANPVIYFTTAKLMASSRGIGFTNWVVIDCQ